MPVATRTQKREQEPKPKKLEDLPLELVEKIAHHLDVEDVVKLMMVNKRLYASYAMDQSIVFGKHVAVVALGQNSPMKNWIRKSVDSPYLQLNATLLPFVKRIDSCDKLDIVAEARWTRWMPVDQLKSVNQLNFSEGTKEDCLKFLTNFCGSVKKHASLRFRPFVQDQEVTEQLGKFIENQLNGCEEIFLSCDFRDCYHEIVMKTQVKKIAIAKNWSFSNEFEQTVRCIVNRGIPSKNSEAGIFITMPTRFEEKVYDPVVDFLSQKDGLERIDDGEIRSARVSRANDFLKGFFRDRVFGKDSLCFHRRIDPTTSCIYLFEAIVGCSQFLAFFMPFQ